MKNNMNNYEKRHTTHNTDFFADEISNCGNIEEFRKKVLQNLNSQEELWKEKINSILDNFSGSDAKFARLCDVSKMTVSKWRNGAVPRNRDTFIRIGLAADYNIADMNELLNRYGNYSGLYSKNISDCICIFVLNKYSGEEKVSMYNEILNRFSEAVNNENTYTKFMVTAVFDEKLAEVKNKYELEAFINQYADVFKTEYKSFYVYVKLLINENYIYHSDNASNLAVSKDVEEMAAAQGWTASLKKCVSEIYNETWIPNRNMIISLGIHLSMTHEQIDNMLKMVHMEPLYSKNIFESVIMYILDSAMNDNMFDIDSDNFYPDDLLKYADRILDMLDIEEVKEFALELSGERGDEI